MKRSPSPGPILHSPFLAQIERLDPWLNCVRSDETGPDSRRLRYLCQRFSITEPFTGRRGEHVAPSDLLDDLEAILKESARSR